MRYLTFSLLIGLAACVTIGDSPDDDDSGGNVALFGDSGSGSPAGDASGCSAACDKIDGCGILAKYEVSMSECNSTCVSDASADQIAYVLSASCADVEAALETEGGGSESGSSGGFESSAAGGSESGSSSGGFESGSSGAGGTTGAACVQVCEKAMNCGILPENVPVTACFDWCEIELSYDEQQWALAATCDELAAASSGLF